MLGEGLAEKRKNVSGAVGVTDLKAWRVEEDESFQQRLACPHWREKSRYHNKEGTSLFKALVGENACAAPMTRERIRSMSQAAKESSIRGRR